jgi:hypothetical protein
MTHNKLRRLILPTTLCTLFIAPLPTMSGCESTQLRELLSSPTAMDLLSPLVKDAANSYISNLTDLTAMLGDINNLQGVLRFIDLIEPTINQLKSAYQTLASTSPEERKWLWEAFGPDLKSVNSGFLNQSDALTDNSTWSRLLNPVLENVELFQ